MPESTNRVDVACLGALPLKLVKMLNISTEFNAAERIVPCHFSIALFLYFFSQTISIVWPFKLWKVTCFII